MKNLFKKTTAIALLSMVIVCSAQDGKKTKDRSNYVDFNVGSTRLGGAFQGYGPEGQFPGYFSETFSPIHFDLGYRRMWNSFLGWKIDFAYDLAKHDEESRKFKSTYYSLRAQGVVNLVNLLSARERLSKLGASVHGGLGYTVMMLDENLTPSGTVYDGKNWDNIMNGIIGAQVSYRISNRWALNLDYSFMFLGKVQTQLDGSRGNHGSIDGNISNLSIGASVNVGKSRKNYDWDGIAEGSDLESGVQAAMADMMVNVDDLQKQIDDLKNQLANQPDAPITQAQEMNIIEKMFQENLIYAYFNFDKDEPNVASNDAIVTTMKYLSLNPSAKINLVGYADNRGSEAYNKDLALRRAERIKAILVELGANGSNITTQTEGIDTQYNVNSEGARQVVRRVRFELK